MTSSRQLSNRLTGAASASPAATSALQRPGGSEQPAGGGSIKYSLRLDRDVAESFDQLHLRLRRETGQRVNKSDVIRTLIELVTDDNTIRATVAERLAAQS
jgi:hypothetical protein